ncbi:cupin-type [Botryosphaeria dothidea]|uniref:Cupin-type n=1 Tax=Botryosphaeria dothidea TaxID=55169 RepID=A0A8H4IVD8_9PEZI|nr:cupin-type [Botryosphaeria dothidea]
MAPWVSLFIWLAAPCLFLTTSAAPTATSQPPGIPPTRRIITGHDASARVIITHDDLVAGSDASYGVIIQPLWSTAELPPDVSSPADKGLADVGLHNNGTVLRVVGFPPKTKGEMHRTWTLDYLVVLEGEVTLTLEEGGTAAVARGGDVMVQQATLHGWENDGDEWARLFCVLVKSQPPVVGGEELPEVAPKE